MCDKGAVFLSTFLSAPSQRPEPGTVGKLLNGTTEYAETGDVHAEPLEIQALVCRPKLHAIDIHVLRTYKLASCGRPNLVPRPFRPHLYSV